MIFARRVLFAISTAVIIFPAFALGAPTGIITWKATTYSPKGFSGRSLPPAGAPIDAHVTLTDTGTIADLSEAMIRWYANGELLTSGIGKTSFSFVAPGAGQDMVQIRVSLPDYAASPIDTFRDIPVVRPDIAIDRARLPELIPLFYSFSITNPLSLSVTWDDTDPATAIVNAKNPTNPFEFAHASIER